MGELLEARITVTGLDKALSQLSKLDSSFKGLEPALQEAGRYMLDFFMNDVFTSKGGDIQEFWAALSEPYATNKLRKYGAQPILVATGKMKNSYKLATASDSFTISNEAQTDRGDYYAMYHQEGTDRMPRRMMMKFQPEQLNKVRDIIIEYLNSKIRSL